jgi:hypothetical protein
MIPIGPYGLGMSFGKTPADRIIFMDYHRHNGCMGPAEMLKAIKNPNDELVEIDGMSCLNKSFKEVMTRIKSIVDKSKGKPKQYIRLLMRNSGPSSSEKRPSHSGQQVIAPSRCNATQATHQQRKHCSPSLMTSNVGERLKIMAQNQPQEQQRRVVPPYIAMPSSSHPRFTVEQQSGEISMVSACHQNGKVSHVTGAAAAARVTQHTHDGKQTQLASKVKPVAPSLPTVANLQEHCASSVPQMDSIMRVVFDEQPDFLLFLQRSGILTCDQFLQAQSDVLASAWANYLRHGSVSQDIRDFIGAMKYRVGDYLRRHLLPSAAYPGT